MDTIEKYLLYIFAFMVPLFPQKIKVSGIPLSADTILGFLIILVFMINLLVNYSIRDIYRSFLKFYKKDILIKAVTAYIIAVIISLYNAFDVKAGLLELFRFLSYVMLYYIVIAQKDKQFAKKFISVFIFSISISVIYGISQYVFRLSNAKIYDNPLSYGMTRVYSTFFQANYWGAFINLIIFPMALLINAKRHKLKDIYLLFIVIGLLVNIILTLTRGAWLAFIFGLFVLILLVRDKRVIVAALCFVFIIMLVPGVNQRFISSFNTKAGNVSERFILWKTGITMFKDYPIFGIGNGNTVTRYKEYVTRYPELYTGHELNTVHNSYIKVMAETGVVGIIPFMSIIAVLIINIIKIIKRTKDPMTKRIGIGILTSLSAYLFQNFSNNMFFIPQVNVFMWIMIALFIRYSKLNNQEVSKVNISV